ncbi:MULTISPECIES: ferritin-like domain-containing protein [unclassified Nitratiruptor]|uniref:ferritin-like domain-containing protein n=1 Tax=unclassified Nitratiruptor TaxID=2624044 RepID=UPI0019152674|nr:MULTISPECIES: ferritin-like domain-containing protein [unclassified Nitratiruptor]BCD61009.1 hypothetical protein NitYY0810_C1790 [Nitratiruptor sp. YY08-10]BCD64941.1 hypothetical protein NitYY0814_C1798 [Nitratiruptor sp. YY08-14]
MRWHYEDIDYSKVNSKEVREYDFLFFLITSASFIEITSDVYEKNLAIFYADNKKVVDWLENVWEPEELQHGRALRKYVQSAWPDFDWDAAYERFKNEYLPLCTLDEFQPTKAKEMLARMVVETGTSTFYKAIERFSKDLDAPVLGEIAHNISKDEVYHYDVFYDTYKEYNKTEKLGRDEVIKVEYDRLKMVDGEDGRIAFKAIYESTHDTPFRDEIYEQHKKNVAKFAKKYYPYNMAIKMLLQPLNLNKTVEKVTVPMVRGALKILGI